MHLKKLSFLTIFLLSLGLTGCGSDNLDAINGNTGDSSNDSSDDSSDDSPGDTTDDGSGDTNVYTATFDTIPRVIQRGQTLTLNYPLDKTTPSELNYSLNISGTAVMGENADYTISNAAVLTFTAASNTASLTITTYQKQDVYDARTLNLIFTDSDGDQFTQPLLISGNVYLNDSGVSNYSDGSDFTLGAQPGDDLALQDAAYGLDVIINSNALANAGGDIQDPSSQFYKNSRDIDSADTEYKGRAGFRFVKIGNDGMPRTANSTDYSCVKDEITGLTWQVKGPTNLLTNQETDNTLPDRYTMDDKTNYSAANFVYAWWSSKLGTTGRGWRYTLNDSTLDTATDDSDYANATCGYLKDLSGRENELYCSSGAYADEVNFLGVCGQANWLVPSVEQLRSIIDYSKVTDYSTLSLATDHALDSDFFDCTGNDCVVSNDGNPVYWTSSQVKGAESLAWCINLQTGSVNTCNKDEGRKVMLVSSNIPAEFFTQAADDSAESE
ncbi:DUF1566 domain-containing protein [Moritella marina ATCC 15381]|uniref:DUF1566 domain-containing protein n=1 Tax=Moritella marina ATCC 15381 TaxID=1202962 RepID=A0A5J6WQZ6_MORMI|nr:DUF1566 domain-containing protein [Moritella marina]QFI39834.1 DUF1566 domain-containing protein [Moritella marina ATCC 15381]